MDLVVPSCSFHLLEYWLWINKKSLFPQMNIDRKVNWPSPKHRDAPPGPSEGPKVSWPSLRSWKVCSIFYVQQRSRWNVWFFLTFENHKTNSKPHKPSVTYNLLSTKKLKQRADVFPPTGREFRLHFISFHWPDHYQRCKNPSMQPLSFTLGLTVILNIYILFYFIF